ncbi:hypothetical protein ACFUJ0_13165 [Streptomyces sp. NPDC057242]|uniref:hypothetical protein n=1 Tax=unclassified Streptomyces TaxID=2593676 RepID=UPI003629EF72
MTMPYFQVNVPTRSSTHPERHGFHLFTGPAGCEREALRIARETCEAALDAQAAGSRMPRREYGGWGASGIRPGWDFDWPAASVRCWDDIHLFGFATRDSIAHPYDERAC